MKLKQFSKHFKCCFPSVSYMAQTLINSEKTEFGLVSVADLGLARPGPKGFTALGEISDQRPPPPHNEFYFYT